MKVFYGWRMEGAAFGIQFMFAALLNQAFGVYVAIQLPFTNITFNFGSL